MDSPSMVAMSLLMLGCSGCCVVTSVLLLIGLCVDSRMLLIPWLISVFSTTAMDIIMSVYLLIDAQFNTFLVSLFSIDFILCALNAYCLLCVYSQYQEYVAGRGHPQARTGRQLPPVEYQREGCSSSVTKITNDSMALTQPSSAPPGVSDATINSEYSSTIQNVEEISNGKEKEPTVEKRGTTGEMSRNSSNGIQHAVYITVDENGGRISNVSFNKEGDAPKEEIEPFV